MNLEYTKTKSLIEGYLEDVSANLRTADLRLTTEDKGGMVLITMFERFLNQKVRITVEVIE